MKAVVQRVFNAAVTADGNGAGRIENGLLVLLGVAKGDTDAEAELLAKKVAELRVFCDGEGRMNRSVADVSGSVLVVSNFTLAADIKKGTRPSFDTAMEPGEADRLYEYFVSCISQRQINVATGEFGAKMVIDMQCDGPVTIVMDTDIWRKKQ